MPNREMLLTRANAQFDAIYNLIVTRQEKYISTHKIYWQGLMTHSSLPEHSDFVSADRPPDRLSAHPTDVKWSWLDMFPGEMTGALPFAVWVESYDGPRGRGFVVHAAMRHNGDTLWKSRGFGAEKDHNHDWEVVKWDSMDRV